ncbi:Leucine-rich repeat [Seminavis robusta]|uniref:Leucine-rich repeat n=1 Tax=Seminavis robusta TaxID=568900 RepID=A0A9N8EDC3_9STRA|nr:Leucine-rich repeat [Seminavis robusta]|eukprot:Sro984_g227890.1 Leucine-rich repeat (818) ;mRNA; r:7860-11145
MPSESFDDGSAGSHRGQDRSDSLAQSWSDSRSTRSNYIPTRNSEVARLFLEDDSNSGSDAASDEHSEHDDDHSSLYSDFSSNRHENDRIVESLQVDTQQQWYSSRTTGTTGSTWGSGSDHSSRSNFPSRVVDLRQVDQTINLMDVEAASYMHESSSSSMRVYRSGRGSPKRGKKKPKSKHNRKINRDHKTEGSCNFRKCLYRCMAAALLATVIFLLTWAHLQRSLGERRKFDTDNDDTFREGATAAPSVSPDTDASTTVPSLAPATPLPTTVPSGKPRSTEPTQDATDLQETDPTQEVHPETEPYLTDSEQPHQQAQSPSSQQQIIRVRRQQILDAALAKHRFDTTMPSPHAQQAREWLVTQDDNSLLDDSITQEETTDLETDQLEIMNTAEIAQRFVLASLFFATRPNWAVQTMSATNPSPDERHGQSAQEKGEKPTTRRLQDDAKEVTPSTNCNLNGTLPQAELAWLLLRDKLLTLDLSHNNLHGQLPQLGSFMQSYDDKDDAEDDSKDDDDGDNDDDDDAGIAQESSQCYLELFYAKNNSLSGTLPEDYLVFCQELYHLDLSDNRFVGSIPKQIKQMPHLRQLSLQGNSFEGRLPDMPPRLTDLRCSNNKLNGRLPTGLTELIHLENLELGSNRFSGTLDSDILQRLDKLAKIDLHNNSLSGSIGFATSPPSLVHFIGDHNSFTGTIPDFKSNLQSLIVHSNKLQGSLPDLGHLTLLEELWLAHNPLVGTIPPTVANLRRLKMAILHDTELSGSIPASSLEEMKHLEYLKLHNNPRLHGTISSGLCNLKHLANLNYVSADCNSRVECPCCDRCY